MKLAHTVAPTLFTNEIRDQTKAQDSILSSKLSLLLHKNKNIKFHTKVVAFFQVLIYFKNNLGLNIYCTKKYIKFII